MKNAILGCVLGLCGLFISAGTHAQAAAPQYGASTVIVNASNNQCWDVEGFSTADNAVIGFYPCTGLSNQSWAFQTYSFSDGKSLARIVNVNSGMCAAVEDSNPASGNIGLRQHICDVNDPRQQFAIADIFVKYPIGTGTVISTRWPTRNITSVATGMCIIMNPGFSRPIEQPSCGDFATTSAQWRMTGL